MDIDANLRRTLRRVADAIHGYIAERGWDEHGYRLFFRIDQAWDRILIVMIDREFKKGDYYENYKSVMDRLRSAFVDDPEFVDSVGLVLMGPEDYSGGRVIGLGPEFIDFADEFGEALPHFSVGSRPTSQEA